MRDDEIINDFEKEIKYVRENEKYDDFNPIVDIDLCEDILDLINRQKAEIERLKLECYKLYPQGGAYSMQVEASDRLEHQIKSEAIKEFAERLTDIICDNLNRSLDNPNGNDYFITDVYTTINHLVKEMTEENENDRA